MAAPSGTMLRPLAVMMNRKIRTVSPDAALTARRCRKQPV